MFTKYQLNYYQDVKGKNALSSISKGEKELFMVGEKRTLNKCLILQQGKHQVLENANKAVYKC